MRWILTDRRKRVTSGWREEAEASPEAGGEEGDGDRETWRERDRVTCRDNEETKTRASYLDIGACLPSMYLLSVCLSGGRHA